MSGPSFKLDSKMIAYYTGLALVGFIAVMILMTAFTFGAGQWIRETAGWSGKTKQIQATRGNAQYRIAAYDAFYDSCAAIQDQEVTIAAQMTEYLDSETTSKRKAQIRANISALTANRNELINHYNTDARKEATRGQFRASDLPYQIDRTQEATTCTA